MAASAFVLGETGQIGTEVAKLLATCGWKVTTLDRGTRARGTRARGRAGADVVVDTVAFDSRCAAARGLAGVVGSVVAISSASVYRDIRGRTLDEATKDGSLRYCP